MLILLFIAVGCKKTDSNIQEKNGTLYYSSASALVQYNFQSKQEITLFSGGDNYRISENEARKLKDKIKCFDFIEDAIDSIL